VAGVVALASSSALVLVACGGDAVTVDPFDVKSADRAACRQFLSAAPKDLADQSRRDVSGSSYVVAWGDPAIVLRCGVPLPKGFAGAPCFTRNGIGWSIPVEQADDVDEDIVMTLAFRTPVVQLRVPAAYRPDAPGTVMADLDAAVRAHTIPHGKCS
jgi:hypothetical protein